jgi:D-3-phosphoglycerate dehydrogenase
VKIWIADRLGPEAVHLLAQAGYEVVERSGLAGGELGAALVGSDALLVRGATKVTREVLASANGLRAVARAGSGVDNIDLAACREKGIAVFNAPGANAVSVAEHTWALILALFRRIPEAAASMSAGRWDKAELGGREVRGKTLGVIGFGRIGQEMGRIGLAFGCHVLAHDPLVDVADAVAGVNASALDDLLAASDIVSLHAPLLPETRGLLSAERLARLKPTAVLVNCARGDLVDEAALEKALAEKRLAGAGLDVFTSEPPGDRPLFHLPHVIATPHVAASTPEAQKRAGVEAATAIRDFLSTGRAPGRVA